MATFNATSAVQTLGNGSNNTGNDTFNIPSGSVQAGDVFNGGTGTDTLSMGNNITINFSVATITAMERLQFGNGGSATFNASQFGGSLISDSLTVLGAGGSQAVIINNASNFSAASWTFGSWTSGTDTISINGTSGNDTITGSSEVDTITGGGGADTINAGGGDDIINIANGQFVAGESISGGGGVDSIVLTNATTVDFSAGTVNSVGRLTGSSGNDAVIMSGLQWAGFSTSINLGGGANDTLSVVASGDISALGIPSTISNIETGNLIGTAGTDTVTLTGAQLNAIIIGSGTINLGLGLGDTINLTSTSSDLNSLGATNASIQGVEAISAATAAAGVTINLSGQGEDFTITGSGQADTITGGSGVDIINAGGGADTINGGGGADIINGAGGADIINGGGGADTISGAGGADTINGGGAADTITGGAGADTITGGGGVDTYVWNAGDGNDTIAATGAANEDIILINGTFYDYNFEVAGNDLLVGVAADENYDWNDVGGNLRIENFFTGGDSIVYMEADLGPGNNAFYSPDEVNSHIYFSAINGTDQGNNWEVIIGTDVADVMTDSAGIGTNRFIGLGGDDIMSISDGISATFIGGTGADTMTGADQRDTFRGGSGGDIMEGMGEVDLVRYDRPDGSGAFTHGAFVNLSADAATFDFNGIAGVTVQAGQAIDNWADTDALSEIVTDTLSNIEDVRGSAYDDVIVGSADSNFIEGQGGNDIIAGGAGDDYLVGGGGDDYLVGGADADTFVWNAGDGYDTIVATGDANEDVIQINGTFYDYNWDVVGNDLVIGVAADSNRNWEDVGGNLRIEGFLTGGDSIAYIEADLGQVNQYYYPYDLSGPTRIYLSAVNGTDQGNYFESIMGTSGDDVMTGGGGDIDLLSAFEGNDVMSVSEGTRGIFRGGKGYDTMTGAGEEDEAQYGYSTENPEFDHGAFVNLSATSVTFDFNGAAGVTVLSGQAIDNWGDTDTLSNIENVRGSNLDDVLVGSSGENFLDGLDGDDIIVGGGGDDYLVGGGGVDTYVWNGGDGYDTIAVAGAANEDVIQINGTFYDYNWDVDGDDLLVGVVADDSYTFAGNLRLEGFFAGSDNIAYLEADLGPNNAFYSPGGGNSRIYISLVNGEDQGNYFESIIGTSGDDVMTGGGGAHDFVWGGDGNDTMNVSDGTLGIFRGGNGNDTLTGADQDDSLRGGAGDDIMDGGAGEGDRVEYNRPSGSSPITQGAFVNLSGASVTYDFNGTSGVTVQAGQAIDNWGDTDTLSNIENVRGSAFDDVLVGSAGDNVLEGLGGDDLLAGGAGVDTYIWNAGDGYDTIAPAGAADEDVILINGTFYDYNYNFFDDNNDLVIGVAADENYDWNDVGGNLRIQDFFVGGDSIAYMEADLGSDKNTLYSPDGGNARIYFSAVTGIDQGNNREVIFGTNLADVMTDAGGGGLNRFEGRDGEDIITASNGAMSVLIGGDDGDMMTGADQTDEFGGGEGNDTMDGGDGIDIVTYLRTDGSEAFSHGAFVNLSATAATYDFNGLEDVTVQAGQAIDNWDDTDTLSNIEEVKGSNFDDVIVGDDGDNYLVGRGGNDFIVGGEGGDIIYGGGDDFPVNDGDFDTLIGGGGADSFVFGTDVGTTVIEDFEVGTDLLRFKGDVSIVSLTEEDREGGDFVNDTTVVTLSTGATVALNGVVGVTAADLLAAPIEGTDNPEYLPGTAYNDTLIGKAGDDYLVGGGGVDTYVWNAGDGYDTIAAAGAANEDVIQINGTFYDYNWDVDGDDLLVGVVADDSYTFAGNLRLEGFFAGSDNIAYLEADLGPNNAFYSPGGGNSRIYFSLVNGEDQGNYFESIIGTSGDDVMTGGGGAHDFVWGGDGNDTMSVSDGTLGIFRGGNGNDTLTGADQDDSLRGGAGDDIMDGGAGEGDRVEYNRPSGSSPITQGAFVNLSGASVTYDFNGTSGVTVQAGQAIDNWGDTDTLSNIENVRGSAFDDVLVGSAGDNVLEGLGGDDIIEGGGGNDYLEGGGDANIFVFGAEAGESSIGDFVVNTDFLRLHDGVTIASFSEYDGDFDTVDDSTLVTLSTGATVALIGVTGIGSANDILEPPVIVIDLTTLTTDQGFSIHGAAPYDWTGASVSSAGDVNGDGFDDLIVGAHYADIGGNYSGVAYVVFGNTNLANLANLDLANLDVAEGFVIQGDAAYDFAGRSVSSAGDVNGDGFDDVIVGAPFGDDGGDVAGEAYVVFGGANPASIDLSTLTSAQGFIIQGDLTRDFAGDSVSSAGDVNGDGFDDIIVGAWGADNRGTYTDSDAYAYTGEAYVVFGSANPVNIDLSDFDTAKGFRIQGAARDERAGRSVSSAGDVNGDGFDDVIVGAPYGDIGSSDAGEAYVVFGGAIPANIDLANLAPAEGFSIIGGAPYDWAGMSVSSAGDINGDGFDDVIIGAKNVDPRGDDSGEAYVVFGSANPTNIDLSNLASPFGYVIQGDSVAFGDLSVSSAGDINGDGFDDVIIGVQSVSDGGFVAGGAYVVFGGAESAELDLTNLTLAHGFFIQGDAAYDFAGHSVSSAGDVNGDGFDDVILGASGADSGGSYSGEAYVVLGAAFGSTVTTTGTASAEILIGSGGNDTLTGGGGADILRSGAGDDVLRVSDTGFADVDGGTGFDTLRLDSSGDSLDFSVILSPEVSSIEAIDLTGTGDNSLDLSALDLFQLSDDTFNGITHLTVYGDAGDSVSTLDSGWISFGTTDIGSDTFNIFQKGQAQLIVDNDVTITGILV